MVTAGGAGTRPGGAACSRAPKLTKTNAPPRQRARAPSARDQLTAHLSLLAVVDHWIDRQRRYPVGKLGQRARPAQWGPLDGRPRAPPNTQQAASRRGRAHRPGAGAKWCQVAPPPSGRQRSRAEARRELEMQPHIVRHSWGGGGAGVPRTVHPNRTRHKWAGDCLAAGLPGRQ